MKQLLASTWLVLLVGTVLFILCQANTQHGSAASAAISSLGGSYSVSGQSKRSKECLTTETPFPGHTQPSPQPHHSVPGSDQLEVYVKRKRACERKLARRMAKAMKKGLNNMNDRPLIPVAPSLPMVHEDKPDDKKCPTPLTMFMFDWLLLGDATAANDLSRLAHMGVRLVFSLTKPSETGPLPFPLYPVGSTTPPEDPVTSDMSAPSPGQPSIRLYGPTISNNQETDRKDKDWIPDPCLAQEREGDRIALDILNEAKRLDLPAEVSWAQVPVSNDEGNEGENPPSTDSPPSSPDSRRASPLTPTSLPSSSVPLSEAIRERSIPSSSLSLSPSSLSSSSLPSSGHAQSCQCPTRRILFVRVDAGDDGQTNILTLAKLLDLAIQRTDAPPYISSSYPASSSPSRVLIHCVQGRSRSPALLLAYTMMRFDTQFHITQGRLQIVTPTSLSSVTSQPTSSPHQHNAHPQNEETPGSPSSTSVITSTSTPPSLTTSTDTTIPLIKAQPSSLIVLVDAQGHTVPLEDPMLSQSPIKTGLTSLSSPPFSASPTFEPEQSLGLTLTHPSQQLTTTRSLQPVASPHLSPPLPVPTHIITGKPSLELLLRLMKRARPCFRLHYLWLEQLKQLEAKLVAAQMDRSSSSSASSPSPSPYLDASSTGPIRSIPKNVAVYVKDVTTMNDNSDDTLTESAINIHSQEGNGNINPSDLGTLLMSVGYLGPIKEVCLSGDGKERNENGECCGWEISPRLPALPQPYLSSLLSSSEGDTPLTPANPVPLSSQQVSLLPSSQRGLAQVPEQLRKLPGLPSNNALSLSLPETQDTHVPSTQLQITSTQTSPKGKRNKGKRQSCYVLFSSLEGEGKVVKDDKGQREHEGEMKGLDRGEGVEDCRIESWEEEPPILMPER